MTRSTSGGLGGCCRRLGRLCHIYGDVRHVQDELVFRRLIVSVGRCLPRLLLDQQRCVFVVQVADRRPNGYFVELTAGQVLQCIGCREKELENLGSDFGSPFIEPIQKVFHAVREFGDRPQTDSSSRAF